MIPKVLTHSHYLRLHEYISLIASTLQYIINVLLCASSFVKMVTDPSCMSGGS